MYDHTALFQISEGELQAFKRTYYRQADGKYDVRSQIPHLTRLAEGYITRYNSTKAWTDVLKVFDGLNLIQ